MSVQLALTTAYLFISAILLIYFASYLIQKKNSHFSGLFLLFSFCVVIYLTGYVMELNAHSLEEALFWNNIEYLGIPFISVLWILFILQYMNKYHRLKKHSKWVFLIPPFATMILRLTNRFHHLFLLEYTFDHTKALGTLVVKYGPIYYLQYVFSLFLFIYIMIVLISGLKESDRRQKTSYLVIGLITSLSMLGYTLNFFFLEQTGLDFTAMVMPIFILLLALPIHKQRKLDNQKEEHIPQMIKMVRQVAYRKSLKNALLFSLQKGSIGSESTFFKDSVQYLAQALDMDYVSLHRIEEDMSCTPLAAIRNGKFTDRIFRFDLQRNKSFFESNKPVLLYKNNVQKVFPHNQVLKDLHAESMVQIPLRNPGELPSAVLTFISSKTQSKVKMVKMAADIIGNRITSEIARIKAEKIIQESEEKYRFLVTKMNQGLAVFNCIQENHQRTYIFSDVNPAFETLTGISSHQVTGKSLQEVFPEIYQYAEDHLERTLSHDLHSFHSELYINKYDKYIDVLYYTPKPDQVAVIVSDITERKKREAEIIYSSNHDAVTGLYNRMYYENVKLTINTPENLPLSVVIGDVNGLKLTNDIFGHDEGDRLLIQTSKILAKYCKEGDIVARIGGDEFAILLKNTNHNQAIQYCESINNESNRFNSTKSSGSINPNISLGCATIYHVDESFDIVMQNAEANMYKQKLNNKKKNLNELMNNIKSIMFEKTCETPEHMERLTQSGERLGIALQLSKEELRFLELVSAFHDIGKMKIHSNILSKTEPLTITEKAELRKYPEAGYRIALATPDLLQVADYILCIHERWDGTGYPNRLSGEDIPLISRVFSIVNSYEAMTQDRPYRKALSHDQALEEIKKLKGKAFDPYITDVFIELHYIS